MKIGITKFPGTNNEQDVVRTLKSLDMDYTYIFPNEVNLLAEIDALVIAGGFSYGDYLRPGAIASHSQVAQHLGKFAEDGNYIIGICNGFQILCELGILPGILITNNSTKFICKWVNIISEGSNSALLEGTEKRKLRLPIAHFDGRYFDEENNVKKLIRHSQVGFRYCNDNKEISKDSNPNGSIENIAGIINSNGNVLGMMPHPERASFSYLGSDDGRIIFKNLRNVIKC